MEDLAKELIAESPSLAGVIIVAWLFLRALGKRDDTIGVIAREFAESSKANAEELKSLKEIIGANSEVIKQCTSELGRHETIRVSG